MTTPSTEQVNAPDSGDLKPADRLDAIEKILARSVEFQAEMIAQFASEATHRAERDAKHDEHLTRIDALDAQSAELRIRTEELAAETNKRFTALAISQAKTDERLAVEREQHAKQKAESDTRLDRIEALQTQTAETVTRLAADTEQRAKQDAERNARVDNIAEAVTRLTADTELRAKQDAERNARVDNIAEAVTRLTADTEQRAKQDAARDARVDNIAETVAELSQAVTRLTTATEQRAKQDAARDARMNNIAETVAELKGALTPWKIVLGGIVSVSCATVLSILGIKGVEALLKLL